MRPEEAARRETQGPGTARCRGHLSPAPCRGWPHLLRMHAATIARNVETLLAERRRVSELLVGLLTHPAGLGENTDHLIAALFDRDAGPRFSTDVKAARSLIEHGEGVVTTPLGGGIYGAEVYRVATTLSGLEADQWQTYDCRGDIEGVGHGEAAAIVVALILVRAVQAVQLLDLTRGNPMLLERLDLARGCLRHAPVSAPPRRAKGAARPEPARAASVPPGPGLLRRLLGVVWPRARR